MANKKSDTDSIESGDQVANDEFIEDLDEDELKEIKGGISKSFSGNDTRFGGAKVGGADYLKGAPNAETIYAGSGLRPTTVTNDFETITGSLSGNFDKLKR